MRICLYRAMINKLPTKKKLFDQHIDVGLVCVLCNTGEEDINHLFFQYTFLNQVWSWCCTKLELNTFTHLSIQTILEEFPKVCHNSKKFSDLFLTVFNTTVWTLLNQRNFHIFGGNSKTIKDTCNEIYDIV